MAKQPLELVLVGFGTKSLKEMLDLRGTNKEEELIFAPYNYPPRYRESRACSKEDLENFVEYTEWLSHFVAEVLEKEGKIEEVK